MSQFLVTLTSTCKGRDPPSPYAMREEFQEWAEIFKCSRLVRSCSMVLTAFFSTRCCRDTKKNFFQEAGAWDKKITGWWRRTSNISVQHGCRSELLLVETGWK
jgi:hypothetical protein